MESFLEKIKNYNRVYINIPKDIDNGLLMDFIRRKINKESIDCTNIDMLTNLDIYKTDVIYITKLPIYHISILYRCDLCYIVEKTAYKDVFRLVCKKDRRTNPTDLILDLTKFNRKDKLKSILN